MPEIRLSTALVAIGLALSSFAVPVSATWAAEDLTPVGRWQASYIDGAEIADEVQTILEIREDGSVGGSGGCNSFGATATIKGDRVTFGPVAATRMMCGTEAMTQEGGFFAGLARIEGWRIDQAKRELMLVGADDKTVIRLSRID